MRREVIPQLRAELRLAEAEERFLRMQQVVENGSSIPPEEDEESPEES